VDSLLLTIAAALSENASRQTLQMSPPAKKMLAGRPDKIFSRASDSVILGRAEPTLLPVVGLRNSLHLHHQAKADELVGDRAAHSLC